MNSRFRVLLSVVLLLNSAYAQDSIHLKIDSTHYQQILASGRQLYPYNKKRVRLVVAGNLIGYGSVMVGLNSAWYSQYPRSSFHFFNDNAEWLQVDKAGHAYSAYIESVGSYEMWRWTGLSRKQRIIAGGLSGVAYQSIIEVLDGFSAEYGFSWGDFSANVFGSALFTLQEMAWDDQKIKMKFSFHERNYGQPDLNARANDLFGKTASQRFIKDYNATTDWVSINVRSFFPKSNLPKWFSVAVGYGAEGLFGARENIAKDKNGNITFDRSDVKRYRKWFLAPDVDLTKIHTNKKAIKMLLFFLNSFKFPAPSIEISNGSIKGHWLQF
jgi:uncharacterized protein YfiM (DUF2279 family)